jgi:hypothetical protein
VRSKTFLTQFHDNHIWHHVIGSMPVLHKQSNQYASESFRAAVAPAPKPQVSHMHAQVAEDSVALRTFTPNMAQTKDDFTKGITKGQR